MELEKYFGNFSGVQNDRIVSIGRLTPWKMYNYHMIEVVKKFNDLGLSLRYESYGDGIERKNLMNLVKQLKLEKQVFFHNEIPYSLFKEKINNSLMFIGAGTALIEASACGIPSLIGIENEQKALSYGFLHDTNTYSYQEKQLDFKMLDIKDFILKLKNSDLKDYYEQCNKARNRSKDFDIEKSSMIFMQMIQSSERWTWKSNWITNLLILISLIKHELLYKIKKNGKSFSLTRH
ncbi:glycosyltransferase [Flavobacterium gyeonganense]|uniref:glycosyltransferase n=1 Tax=Flavobacterium gyeonganense TaxID=1310418 RepID=UPI0024145842|nr:glycosyltransferase [Flavobacterium gyeonganense]